jgi:hypothetical protein
VNAIARDAIKKMENHDDLLALFDDAELKRWYGDLVYAVPEKVVVETVRELDENGDPALDADGNKKPAKLVATINRGREVEFKFRHGVCQFFKVIIAKGTTFFRMNVINNSVDFRGEGSE